MVYYMYVFCSFDGNCSFILILSALTDIFLSPIIKILIWDHNIGEAAKYQPHFSFLQLTDSSMVCVCVRERALACVYVCIHINVHKLVYVLVVISFQHVHPSVSVPLLECQKSLCSVQTYPSILYLNLIETWIYSYRMETFQNKSFLMNVQTLQKKQHIYFGRNIYYVTYESYLTAWNKTHTWIVTLVKTKCADIKISVLVFKGLKSSLGSLHTFWFCLVQSSHQNLLYSLLLYYVLLPWI
jgi:hypothetical protein